MQGFWQRLLRNPRVALSLLWLAFIGLVLFVATAVWGWFKRKANV